jgi:hypothetical protein
VYSLSLFLISELHVVASLKNYNLMDCEISSMDFAHYCVPTHDKQGITFSKSFSLVIKPVFNNVLQNWPQNGIYTNT